MDAPAGESDTSSDTAIEEAPVDGAAVILPSAPIDTTAAPPPPTVLPDMDMSEIAASKAFTHEASASKSVALEAPTSGPVAPEAATLETRSDPAPDPITNDPPQPPREPRICGICNKAPGKYKCPRCPLSYCSVPCNKLHKANHPPDAIPAPSSVPPVSGIKRPRSPSDPYRVLLDHRAAIEGLFAKYPNLEAELLRIHAATLPPAGSYSPSPQTPASGNSNALPWKLAPHHVDPNLRKQKQPEPWTRQVGLREGVAQLRRARIDPGDDGDAVREYCDLVLHLLSRDRVRKECEALDVVRREVVDEERGVIRALIEREAGEED